MQTEQNDELVELNWRDYWALVQRRRWWLILSIFVVWGAVWCVSWFLPRLYKSETVILIDAAKIPQQYVVPNVTSDIQDRIQSLSQQVLSRTRLLRVVQESNLYPEMQKRNASDEIVNRMRKDITIELVQAPSQRQDVTAFKIEYSAASPQLAQHVTGELTRLFIDENLRTRQEQSENTTEFLESELRDARQRLGDQENRLREFKSRYLGELPTQLQPNLQILSGLQTQFQNESDALNRAKQQNLYYKSMLGEYKTIQSQLGRGAAPADLSPALDRELSRLRTELNDLSARYTEKHPDVRKLKEQIAETERMKQNMESQMSAASPTNDDPPRATSLIDLRNSAPMLEIESQLKSNELEMQNRERALKRISEEIATYHNRVNQIPVREQQMADLTRDYDQSRTDYESLLAKKNQSQLATALEKRQQGEQFRMLDPPSLPQKPYSPNRLKLSLAALAAGIALGIGLVVVLEIVNDCIYKERELTAILPVTVLVSIPPVRTATEERAGRLRALFEYAAASSMALVIAAALFVAYSRG